MDEISKECGITGVGIDLTDVSRIRKLLEKYPEEFLKKNFTEEEIAECKGSANFAERYAARFAAKEAMAKALGTGFRGEISLKSFWIVNNELGAPLARFDENVRRKMEKLGAKKFLISLTHLKDYAQAIAILSK